jgi:hypothetical protein
MVVKKRMKIMKKIRNTFIISLLALAAASCSQEAHDNPTPESDVEFRVIPRVTGTVETKAAVTGSTFGANMQVGLRIESLAQPLNSMYNNFYASHSGTDWRYFLNGVNTGAKLSGFSSWNTVTVMGYYPYDAAVTDFNAIPFSIAADDGTTTNTQATIDYMVAETKTKVMASANPEVTLQFEHLMTYIYLYLHRQYQGPALTLSKVRLEINNDRKFVVSGTYDADNPNMINVASLISSVKTSNRLDITTNHTITTGTGYTTIPLVIMPQLLAADGDATVTVTLYFLDADSLAFYFDDHNGANPTISFSLSGVDSGTGFQRGKQYRLDAILGTYVHFDGAPHVDDRAIDETTAPEHLEI